MQFLGSSSIKANGHIRRVQQSITYVPIIIRNPSMDRHSIGQRKTWSCLLNVVRAIPGTDLHIDPTHLTHDQ